MQFLHSVLRQNPGIVCALGQYNIQCNIRLTDDDRTQLNNKNIDIQSLRILYNCVIIKCR